MDLARHEHRVSLRERARAALRRIDKLIEKKGGFFWPHFVRLHSGRLSQLRELIQELRWEVDELESEVKLERASSRAHAERVLWREKTIKERDLRIADLLAANNKLVEEKQALLAKGRCRCS